MLNPDEALFLFFFFVFFFLYIVEASESSMLPQEGSIAPGGQGWSFTDNVELR